MQVGGRAARLREQGVGPGSVVAILVRPWHEQFLLRAAVSACGGLDAVLDTGLGDPERESILEILQPDHVIDACPQDVALAVLEDPGRSPDEPLRVLFTTGSTGLPRGALFTVAQVDAAMHGNIRFRGYDADDTVLATLPLFHSAGTLNVESALVTGGAAVFPRRKNLGWIREALQAFPVTFFTAMPSVLGRLLDTESGRKALGQSRLRHINYGAEIMPDETLDRLLKAFSGTVERGYGMTEAGPLVSTVRDEAHRGRRPVIEDIGQPIPGVEVRIGGEGELLVRSPHVMEGYYRDPAATQQALQDGWLGTGDVVRWEGDTLYLLGRLGTRIRKSAQWVHPAEVERVLLGVPGVLTAAVVGATRDGSEQVVAFLEVEPEFEPRKLSSHLRGELARFKWPDWFQPVASLPIRGMGKVDRQRLVEMAGAGPTQGAFNRAGRPV